MFQRIYKGYWGNTAKFECIREKQLLMNRTKYKGLLGTIHLGYFSTLGMMIWY